MPKINIAPIQFRQQYFWGGTCQTEWRLVQRGVNNEDTRTREQWCFMNMEPLPGLRIKVFYSNKYPGEWYIEGAEQFNAYLHHTIYRVWATEADTDLPIKVEITGAATLSRHGGGLDTYDMRGDGVYVVNYNYPKAPYILVPIRVTNTQTGDTAEGNVRVRWGMSGKADWTNLTNVGVMVQQECFGLQNTYPYDMKSLYSFLWLLEGHADIDVGWLTKDELWGHFLTINAPNSLDEAPTKGIRAVFTKKEHKPLFDKLETEEPLLWSYLLWLMDEATREKTSNNKLIKAFLETVLPQGYEALRDGLRDSLDSAAAVVPYTTNYPGRPTQIAYLRSDTVPSRPICLHLPGAVEAENTRKAKHLWQYRQGLEGKADGIGMSPEEHPTLWQALLDEKIPLGVFHAPGKKEQMVNNEFDLWEMALSRPGWADPICAIAQDVASRSTYDKPITPYLAFLMWTLPRYLDRVAPRPNGGKWSCLPKFVESQWELEMQDDEENEKNENGTSKRRSALTPVADNETGVVTVPYISMQVHGMGTTYCYSGNYHVAEQGAVDPLHEAGGVWTTDFEEKLNGRDDYGLMFYTLIGTSRNTGYPTFLIILERLQQRAAKAGISTRVHFHRVHPNRSKNGIPTPTNRLITECYRYMAGNVQAKEITAQQGDLVFIRVDGPGTAVEDPKGISDFESHAFVPLNGGNPVRLVESLAKHPTNRLGYLYSEGDFSVRHPEHEDIERLEAGWYECRRCRSWEANPTSVWSYTVD